jgi:hypothetical protein
MTPPRLLLTRELRALGLDRAVRERSRRGDVVQIVRGVYIDARVWREADPSQRYRWKIDAVARLHPATVFSHESAAAVWGLPLLRVPPRVHSRVPLESSLESNTLLRRHAIGQDPGAVRRDGVMVTSVAATLADACTLSDIATAVGIVDAGLRADPDGSDRAVPTKPEVLAQIEALRTAPGVVRAKRTLDFADPRSGSLGESVTRVQLNALGWPRPQLQVAFHDARGHIGDVDFFWPDLALVAEFDGAVKYGDRRRFRRDLTHEQILVEEKRREDRLRALGLWVIRLDWTTVMDRSLLALALNTDRSFRR